MFDYFLVNRRMNDRTSVSANCRAFILIFLLMAGCKTTKVSTTQSGLQYTILKKGAGPKAKAGQEILLFETTSYRDGTVLYSNENTTTPVKVLIGGNQATQAVDEALRGMQEGEVKRITAPPHLVKRKSYPENVHPDSTLVIKMILHKIL
jgi:FKBP-type peptidyl-prolyl cis-trans isomerase